MSVALEPAVSIRSLTRTFGRVVALQDVSFDVPGGSTFGLLGPNGAGKTTLFSVAAGFLRATSGSVEILGTDTRCISRLCSRFSMLPQDASFQAGIPVVEQLVMFARLGGADDEEARERALHALDLVGLADVAKRSARALSHGMLKRVALCQAFLGDPEVIFLDEPTAGLDPENARRMRDLIKDLKQKKTVVVSSHNLHEIQEICDHVAILDHGRLLLCGAMDDLTLAGSIVRIAMRQPLTAALLGAFEALEHVQEVVRTGEDSFNLRLSAAARDAALRAVLETFLELGVFPRSLQEGASLETRFLEITGGTFDGTSST